MHLHKVELPIKLQCRLQLDILIPRRLLAEEGYTVVYSKQVAFGHGPLRPSPHFLMWFVKVLYAVVSTIPRWD